MVGSGIFLRVSLAWPLVFWTLPARSVAVTTHVYWPAASLTTAERECATLKVVRAIVILCLVLPFFWIEMRTEPAPHVGLASVTLNVNLTEVPV